MTGEKHRKSMQIRTGANSEETIGVDLWDTGK